MKRPGKTPLFLQRDNYRQRRVRSAAKLIPFVGLLLWALPLTWNQDPARDQVGSIGVIYIFSVWVLLIALTAVTSHRLAARPPDDTSGDPAP